MCSIALALLTGVAGFGASDARFFIIKTVSALPGLRPLSLPEAAETPNKVGSASMSIGDLAGVPISVSLPNLTATPGTILVPITVDDLTGLDIIAADLQVTYDSAVVTPASPPFDRTGTLTASATVNSNTNNPGHLLISIFQTATFSGSGTFINLRFNVIGSPGQSSGLIFENYTDPQNNFHFGFRFNEGTPASVTTNGSVTIPAATATNTATATATATETFTPTATATETFTPTATATETFTPTPTATETFTPTATATETFTPTATATETFTPTATETFTPTATATQTFTPTSTATETFTPTATATETLTPTATATETFTPTPTATETFTPTATATETFTPTASATETFTPTATATETFTPTATATETFTPTVTATETFTPTATDTPTATATQTFTPTPTATETFTPTATDTPTATATETFTPTAAATETFTPTATDTPTATATETFTPTATATDTPAPTATDTSTPTATDTPTATATETFTPTAVATETFTQTATDTPTATATETFTPTPTATETFTPTATATETFTPTATETETFTPTATATETFTPTATDTPTATATETFTPTATATETFTPTATETFTPTATATETFTPTATATETFTPTATDTPTATATETFTPTATDTPTATATETFTPTATDTPTATATETFTPTATDTPTATATETFTPTATATETFTPTSTATETFTPTATATETFTPTSTATNTFTPTSTATETFTPTSTATNTFTPTSTATETFTPTSTATNTFTPTSTATNTFTPTPTATNTFTPTATSTNTFTPTATSTNTFTPTPTPICATVSVPHQTAFFNAAVSLPVNTSNTAGMNAVSATFTVTYDPNVITPSGVTFGAVGSSNGGGRTLSFSNPAPGVLTVSISGASEFQGSGTLVNLNFTVIALPGLVSPVNITAFQYNAGPPCGTWTNGSVTVIAGTVSGTVTYGNVTGPPSPRYVPNVLISGLGSPPVSTLTNSFGAYSLSGFGSGAYAIVPSKPSGDDGAISGLDAARIIQHVVRQLPFTAAQTAVADVSGTGGISSFDATLLAKYIVAIPDSGSTGNWVFNPVRYTHQAIYNNIPNENFTALLMGEVSGNWNAPSSMHRSFPDQTLETEKSTSVNLPHLVTPADKDVVIPITVQGAADGGFISYEFDLRYDPAVLQPQVNPVDTTGTVSRGLLSVANTQLPGLLRVVVYGPTPIDSDGILLNLKFTAVGAPGSVSPLTWERLIFNEGDSSTALTDGQVEISKAESDQADITGRLLTAFGEAIPPARVTLTDTTGQSRSVLSNASGDYRFGGLQLGQTYTVTVRSKNRTFIPLTISVTSPSLTVDLVAEQ